MKKTRRLLPQTPAILLLLLSLILASLPSCATEGPADGTTSLPSPESSQPETEAVQIPEVTEGPDEPDPGGVASFLLIDGGKSAVNIVKPAEAGDHDAAGDAALKIRYLINTNLSTGKQKVTADSAAGGRNHDSVEILVGLTGYTEGSQSIGSLGLGSYLVRSFGNKILVYAHDFAGYAKAIECFTDIFNRYRTVSEDGKVTVDIPRDAFPGRTAFHEGLRTLPRPERTVLRCVYDAGDDCQEVIFSGASQEIYDEYIGTLQTYGYRLYTSNVLGANPFSTLYNSGYTLNVGYYAYSREIRVIVEPFSDSTLIGLEEENVFTRVCTQTATIIGLEYDEGGGTRATNGMCVLFKLSDGRFVIIDGGFNTASHAELLINTIKSQHAGGSSYDVPTVAAWILTHNHNDHTGVINGRAAMFYIAGIKVERVIFNYIDENERTRSEYAYPANWGSGEGGGSQSTYRAVKTLKAEKVIAHVGQVFHIADLRMEVLYTLESRAPEPLTAFNGTSLMIKLIFTDSASGKQTSYLCTGDATGTEFRVCIDMYGDYLKSDIGQVAHHGFEAYGNESFTRSAYILIAPTIVFWPVGTTSWGHVSNVYYNKVIIDKKFNTNYKQVYIAGQFGEVKTYRLR
jgi:hypothetical protein